MTRRVLVALVAVALIGAACSGDDDGGSPTTASTEGEGQPLRIDAMPAAVEAVETELGGEQRYFEVNATPTLVNLFVVTEVDEGTNATSYVYDAVARALTGDPVDLGPATGSSFTWSQVDFDPAKVLGQALGQLPTALPRIFTVIAAGESALQYRVTVESAQGGMLDVVVSGDGAVLSADPRQDDGG